MISSSFRPISLSLLCSFQFFLMLGKSLIRLRDKLLVETLLAAARFVARHKQNCLPFRVEGKGGAPFAIGGRETHLLHIGVFGPVERVHIWPTKEGAIVGKQLRDSEEFRLDVWLKDRDRKSTRLNSSH